MERRSPSLVAYCIRRRDNVGDAKDGGVWLVSLDGIRTMAAGIMDVEIVGGGITGAGATGAGVAMRCIEGEHAKPKGRVVT
jgi:hypothetical protein